MKESAATTKAPQPGPQKALAVPSPIASSRSLVHPIHRLQRAVGNQAVQQFIQAKLSVSQPGDPGDNEPAAIPPIVHEALRSPGEPLDPSTRKFMEAQFRHDFKAVRVHTDGTAAESARALKADAYTAGRDVYFAGSKYSPATPPGDKILAHELAHVVQFDNGRASQPSLRESTISQPTDPLEQEAYAQENVIGDTVSTLRKRTEPSSVFAAGGSVESHPHTGGSVQHADPTVLDRERAHEPVNEGSGPWTGGPDTSPMLILRRREKGEGVSAEGNAAPVPSSVPKEVVSALSGAPGEPLGDGDAWSKRVGGDVSGARVVTSRGAAEAAASVDARAFTVGHRVFMGAGNNASTDNGDLLAHELTHVVQQRDAPAPGSWDQLKFVDHNDARETAARQNDGLATTSEQAIARDAEPDIDATAYRQMFAQQIGDGVVAFLGAAKIETGSRFVQLFSPVLFGPAILDATGVNVEAKLDLFLGGRFKVTALIDKARPKGRQSVTDGKTTWTEDKIGQGPGRWFPDVGVELGAALAAAMRTSLARIIPRYIDAAVALAEAQRASMLSNPTPKPSDIIASSPLDIQTIAALTTKAAFDYPAYHQANPTDRGGIGTLHSVNLAWEHPRKGTYWVRVTRVDDPKQRATAEEAANALFGSPTFTEELAVVAPPLFGFGNATLLKPEYQAKLTLMGADVHQSGDVLAEAQDVPFADELAKAQGATVLTKAATKLDVVRTIDESLNILTTIETAGAAFGMGKNPSVKGTGGLRKKLTERRAKLVAGNDSETLAWAGQAEGQQKVLTTIAFGLNRHGKRLQDLTKLITDPKVKLGGFNLPSYVREGMNRVAMEYADAVAASDLPATASVMLAKAENDAGQLPVEFIEGALASVQRVLDDARAAKRKEGGDSASYDVGGMSQREKELKVRLATVRMMIESDPAGATKELKEIQNLVSELQIEAEIIANMDQIDAAWQALDDGVSWFWSSTGTKLLAAELKRQGDGLHARWKAIFTAWKSGDPAKRGRAEEDYKAFRGDPAIADWFEQVQSALHNAQIEAMIGKLAALLVITVVTAGVGDLVVAGAVGWELSAGATAILAGGAEAVTFTLLSQVFLDDKHDFGHIATDLAANWLMFGVMRRFAIFAEAAKLSKIKSVTTQTTLMFGITFARAEIEKYIREGRHLTSEEATQIAVQGIVMAVAMHAIAPATKPMFQELEGAAYSFTSRLKANNATQRALKVRAEALQVGTDLKAAQAKLTAAQNYVAAERAWLEERVKLLDEIEAQAAKEDPHAKNSISAKIKLTPEQLKTLRTEINANLIKLQDAEVTANLEPLGPGLFSCPREHIGDVVKNLGEQVGQATDPTTKVTTYKVKLPDGKIVTVMEKLDPATEWVNKLESQLSSEQLARFKSKTKGKSAQQIHDEFIGDIVKLNQEMDVLRGKYAAELRANPAIETEVARVGDLLDPSVKSKEMATLREKLSDARAAQLGGPRTATGALDLDAWGARLKANGVKGDIDSIVARAKGSGPDAIAARGELRTAERARLRGHDVEMLTPPSGPGTKQGVKSPEGKIVRGGEEGRLEAKTATAPPDRGTWNTHADTANKQIKASGKPGEISFDWTEADLAAGGDFKSAGDVQNFLNGKMTNDRLREVRYFEIVWKDSAGRTWVTSRSRGADGMVGAVVTELL